METAKAVVDVPSPVSGKVLKLAGGAGDVIVTGTMLAEFELDPNAPQRAEGQDTGHHHGGAGSDAPSDGDKVIASDEGGEISRSEEHTSELQSLMRISYAVFCLNKKKKNKTTRRKSTQ